MVRGCGVKSEEKLFSLVNLSSSVQLLLPPGCSEPEIFDIPPEAAFTLFWSCLCCYVITLFIFVFALLQASFLCPVGLTSGLCYILFTCMSIT